MAETNHACIVGNVIANVIVVDETRADWNHTKPALLEHYDEIVDVRELPTDRDDDMPAGVGWTREAPGQPFRDARFD